jgi:beta-1,4-mannosyl-glycoprotein beta-1,4-N-acetylglucosaminyltransferase
MYFDEEMILDLRLNILNKYVDYFVIVESTFTHRGEKRKLKFNQNKFEHFKDKIIYLIYDQIPENIEDINTKDTENEKSRKLIMNAVFRENGQRNFISKGLKNAESEDIVLISDVDEIPNLNNLNFNQINQKIFLFEQDMFYYKFNLKLPNLLWKGTKGCRKKNLKSPQWLRNIKDRKYPFYRIDAFFSEKKFINCKIIKEGGWHFTNIKTADEIKHKLKSYLHHIEFDKNPLTTNEIDQIIKDKIPVYDLSADKRQNKLGGNKLENYPIQNLPKFLIDNLEKYKEWMDI